MRSLEQVLADVREEAQILRRSGYAREAENIERILTEVQEAAHEFVTWLTEEDAMLRADRSRRWLRSEFPKWERMGHARKQGRKRFYRMLIVPVRANTSAAFEDGIRTADEEREAGVGVGGHR